MVDGDMRPNQISNRPGKFNEFDTDISINTGHSVYRSRHSGSYLIVLHGSLEDFIGQSLKNSRIHVSKVFPKITSLDQLHSSWPKNNRQALQRMEPFVEHCYNVPVVSELRNSLNQIISDVST